MRTRDLIGKRIAAIEQSWASLPWGRKMTVDAIVLDDGTRLIPHGYEGDADLIGDILVSKPKRTKRTHDQQHQHQQPEGA